MTKSAWLGFAAAVASLNAPWGVAHHSFAMFDLTKEVTVEAAVKDVQFTNPHTWIQILVTDEKGRQTEWGIEAGARGMMTRAGWTSTTLKPGDKITLVMHPLRDGKPNGSLIRVTLPDGRTLGNGGGPPPPPKADASPAP